jgi:putative effector of murein hydrolase LrgA (UPF0299 family)
MVLPLLAILVCQLVGETVTRALGWPLPGPVLGMVLMLAGFAVVPGFLAMVRPVAQGILGHLTLLFVPAGVGVVAHLDRLGGQVLPILLAILGSTVLAIAAGAWTFVLVARRMDNRLREDRE